MSFQEKILKIRFQIIVMISQRDYMYLLVHVHASILRTLKESNHAIGN